MRNNKGFSLVELIVVIAIMAILAAVAIPTFAGFINKANVAADEGFMNDLEYAIELAYAQEPEKEIVEIKVNLAADGKTITSIDYKMTGDTNYTNITKASAATNDVAAVADWGYTFKAGTKVGDASTTDTWVVTKAN